MYAAVDNTPCPLGTVVHISSGCRIFCGIQVWSVTDAGDVARNLFDKYHAVLMPNTLQAAFCART